MSREKRFVHCHIFEGLNGLAGHIIHNFIQQQKRVAVREVIPDLIAVQLRHNASSLCEKNELTRFIQLVFNGL